MNEVEARRSPGDPGTVSMSSVGSCAKLIAEGADAGFVKWDVGTWEGWARDEW